jgi:stage III sporulation protein SpoIIIAA
MILAEETKMHTIKTNSTSIQSMLENLGTHADQSRLETAMRNVDGVIRTLSTAFSKNTSELSDRPTLRDAFTNKLLEEATASAIELRASIGEAMHPGALDRLQSEQGVLAVLEFLCAPASYH